MMSKRVAVVRPRHLRVVVDDKVARRPRANLTLPASICLALVMLAAIVKFVMSQQ